MKRLRPPLIIGDFEPFLLFFAFFFPGYLAQGADIDQALFNDTLFNVSFIITCSSQALLLYYLVTKKTERDLGSYGFKPLDPGTVLKSILVTAGIFVCMVPFILIAHFGNPGAAAALENPVQWRITGFQILPLILLTCITTGYREEIFFRSYLICTTEHYGFPTVITVLISSGLFSLGHVYQGLLGFLGTFTIGVFLSIIFIRKRNLHMVALGHGFYNFITLALSVGTG